MIGSGHCLSVNAENMTTIFVLSGIFCFCVYPVSSNYTVCKRFTEEPLHRLTAVPLVLSGPFCPAGISPPRGESPLSGEAFLPCKFLSTKIPRRGIQAAAAAVTLPFLQLKLGRKVSGDSPLSLLKRKKEAKKEKSSHSTCTTRSSITRRLHINKNPPAGRTGGCCRRNTTRFTLEIGA